MSAEHTDHAEAHAIPAHSPEEEIAHAQEHALVNIYWFIGFFSLILLTVALYEFTGTTQLWAILLLAAARSLLIAFFLHWLFSSFSFVFRTLIFTIVFLGGMIFLSWWDSTLPHLGDPIAIPTKTAQP